MTIPQILYIVSKIPNTSNLTSTTQEGCLSIVSTYHVLVQHNINLHIQLIPRMIRLQPLNIPDRLRKPHRQIQQHIPLIRRRRRST